jgi:hypothetical protein
MDLSSLDHQPRRVVEAEIFRRYNSPVSFDPLTSSCKFFLVVSIGRCKFRISEHFFAVILQSVIGGLPNAFRIRALSDRVFRFSVHSQEVGFHVYRLRSYECNNFKIFFHLWNGGGPNFCYEYNLWLHEQSKQWVEIVKKKSSKPKPLSGANLVQLGTRRVLRSQVQNSKPIKQGHQSAFICIKPRVIPAFNPALKGILGPHPSRVHLDSSGSGPFTRGLHNDFLKLFSLVLRYFAFLFVF